MDDAEARTLLAEEIDRARALGFGELARLLDAPQTRDRVGPSGRAYGTEIVVVWDDPRRTHLRVFVSIDDGGLSVLRPLTDDFIVNERGEFIGE
jgi:hypothetical protein